MNWRNVRLVCEDFNATICLTIKMLVFNEGVPRRVLMQILHKFTNVSALVLDRAICVSDDVLEIIFERCHFLRYLGLAYCTNVSACGLSPKPPHVTVCIHGCWKLLDPHPSISAVSAVEIQILALRSQSQEGIDKMMSFVSPGIQVRLRGIFKLQRSGNVFDDLMYNEGLTLHKLSSQANECSVVVEGKNVEGAVFYFRWTLSKSQHSRPINQCWLTTSIQPVSIEALRQHIILNAPLQTA